MGKTKSSTEFWKKFIFNYFSSQFQSFFGGKISVFWRKNSETKTRETVTFGEWTPRTKKRTGTGGDRVEEWRPCRGVATLSISQGKKIQLQLFRKNSVELFVSPPFFNSKIKSLKAFTDRTTYA